MPVTGAGVWGGGQTHRLTDIENRFVVAKGKEGLGEGRTGSLGLANAK